MKSLRRFVPRPVRHRISVQLARAQAGRLERDLASLASGDRTIIAGPWLGEVGFELLYWVPFLRWFADRFQIAPERLLVVSRGGTASWYRPFAGRYREIFDYLTPDEFRRRNRERVAANGEQKQTEILEFERGLLRTLATDVQDRVMLHPSSMYRLFSPFWWGHVDEAWVHRYARYAKLEAPDVPGYEVPERPYTAVKFYFNECFPATDANRAFVRATLQRLLCEGRVVSLTTGLDLDDHAGFDAHALGVRPLPSDIGPANNLAVQASLVAGASAFIGTYGGFSYLAPFLGVPTRAYYDNPDGFSARHLVMARSALCLVSGREGMLDVQPRATTASVSGDHSPGSNL